jgi:CRP-like cAMP-binding protein
MQVTEARIEPRLSVGEFMSSILRPANHLLQSLSAAEFEALSPHLESVEMVREAVLVEAGAPLTHVYLPHCGIISLVVRLSEGQTVEVAMVGRDGVFGAAAALDGGISLTDAVVMLPGPASILEVARLRAAADRSAGFRTLLVRHEQALLAQAQQSAACNASHSVEARLSRWLLRTRDLCGSENLPLTQEFLAQMIGVQRNAVSIVAHALQQAGIVSYSRGHIEIKDLEALRETSCECYEAVRTQYDRLLGPPAQP